VTPLTAISFNSEKLRLDLTCSDPAARIGHTQNIQICTPVLIATRYSAAAPIGGTARVLSDPFVTQSHVVDRYN
jgi:hypothetical protein